MLSRFAAILRNLRSRPRHERRILGLTTYVSTAAIVIALWLTSLQGSLNLPTVSQELKPGQVITEKSNTGAGIAEPQAATPAASEPQSPFRALKDAVNVMVSGVKELQFNINRLGREFTLAPDQKTSTPPSDQNQTLSEKNSEDITLKIQPETATPPAAQIQAPADAGKSQSADKKTPGSPAEIINAELKTKTHSSFTAALLASPPTLAQAMPEPKPDSGIGRVLSYNFSQMRQAAIDFYKYLTE